MGGLPRSGSTVLTALLNQHPDIYASPQSHLVEMYYLLEESIYDSEPWKAGLLTENTNDLLASLGNYFYSSIEKPIIIDKNRNWGTPGNVKYAKILNENAKTIICLRPIAEILASFVRLANKNPNNVIDIAIKDDDFYGKYYRSIDDVRCDYLMRGNGEIDRSLLAIATLIQNPKNCHIIWYNDFLLHTQEVLTGVYNFLEVDNFYNNLNKIKQLDKHKDEDAFGIKDLHTISSFIRPSKTNPELLLSPYIMAKYQNCLDFLVSQ